jgi:hypothetical protein
MLLHEEDPCATVRSGSQGFDEPFHDLRRKAEREFVNNEDKRISCQRSGDREDLLLAA